MATSISLLLRAAPRRERDSSGISGSKVPGTEFGNGLQNGRSVLLGFNLRSASRMTCGELPTAPRDAIIVSDARTILWMTPSRGGFTKQTPLGCPKGPDHLSAQTDSPDE